MDEPIDPAFLRDSELFENQPAEVIRAVLAQGQLLEFGPGEVVFRQGEEGDRLYVVKSGVLEVVATPTDGSEPTVVAYLGQRRGDRRARAAHGVAAQRHGALARSTPCCSPSTRPCSST